MFFSRPVTIRYPEGKRAISPRWRGMHYFERNPQGETACVACGLCVAVCPSHCIRLEIREREDGTRYPGRYELDALRCIYCGFCEDACPTEAIVLGDNYELSFFDRRSAIYTKDMLLEPVPAPEMLTPQKTEAGKYNRRSVPEMKNPSD